MAAARFQVVRWPPCAHLLVRHESDPDAVTDQWQSTVSALRGRRQLLAPRIALSSIPIVFGLLSSVPETLRHGDESTVMTRSAEFV
jgi:hypothetical protein